MSSTNLTSSLDEASTYIYMYVYTVYICIYSVYMYIRIYVYDVYDVYMLKCLYV